MASYLRGPDVSFNSLAANGDLFSTIGFIDFTIPEDWDDTSSDVLTITVLGGIQAVGPAPDTFDVFLQGGIYTVNGGSSLTATLSTSGLSFAIGSVLHGTRIFSTPQWDSVGLNQTATTTVMRSDAVSEASSTLVDGVTFGYSGEGFIFRSGSGLADGPVGWYPQLDFSTDGTAQTKLAAGQTVTFWLYMFSESTDEANPDRTIFGAIQSVTLNYKDNVIELPIADFTVGWSAGESYIPMITNALKPAQFPNPKRAVETTPPPINHPNQQAFIDFYLVSAAVQRTQGYVF